MKFKLATGVSQISFLLIFDTAMIWANVHNMFITFFVQLWQDYYDQNTESDL